MLLALGQFPGEPLSVTGLFPQTQIEVQEDAEQGQQEKEISMAMATLLSSSWRC